MEEVIQYLKKELNWYEYTKDLDLKTDNYFGQFEEKINMISKILNELERLQKDSEQLKNKKYLMSISCDGDCQLCEHCKNEFLLEVENQHLKKGINSLMNSRKKWKNRYYKLKTENSNVIRELLARTDKLNELLKENEKLNGYKMYGYTDNYYHLTSEIAILKELLGDE